VWGRGSELGQGNQTMVWNITVLLASFVALNKFSVHHCFHLHSRDIHKLSEFRQSTEK
jgi:hypothetical protein